MSQRTATEIGMLLNNNHRRKSVNNRITWKYSRNVSTLLITKAATARRLREYRGLEELDLIDIFAGRLCDLPVGVLHAYRHYVSRHSLQMYPKLVVVHLILSPSLFIVSVLIDLFNYSCICHVVQVSTSLFASQPKLP